MVKKNIISLTLSATVISTSLVGCQQSSSKNLSTSATALAPTASVEKDIKAVSSQVTQLVTKEQFLQTLSNFKKEIPQVTGDNSLSLDLFTEIKQLYIVGGDVPYIIAWSSYMANTGILAVYKIEGSEKTPVFCETYGNTIVSVRDFDSRMIMVASKATGHWTPIIEVTAYFAAGQVNGQKVQFLRLDRDKVTNVWECNIFESDAGHITGYKNSIYEHYRAYSYYFFAPTFQDPSGKVQDYPTIFVTEIHENIQENATLKKILSCKKTSEEKKFVWDNVQEKFVEKLKGT